MGKFARVDKEKCIACGSCGDAAPDIFDYDDSGVAEVVFEGDNNRGVTAITDDLLTDLQDAVDSCPTSCIEVADQAF